MRRLPAGPPAIFTGPLPLRPRNRYQQHPDAHHLAASDDSHGPHATDVVLTEVNAEALVRPNRVSAALRRNLFCRGTLRSLRRLPRTPGTGRRHDRCSHRWASLLLPPVRSWPIVGASVPSGSHGRSANLLLKTHLRAERLFAPRSLLPALHPMHAHELADLAALVSVHSEQLVAADAATINQALAAYWKASRCRLDRWCRSLALATRHRAETAWTRNEIGTVQEILVGEILSRVVAAIAVAHDLRHAVEESGPVARNIFQAHVDVKRRTVALVVAPHRDQDQAAEFLALRRQSDRWTDLLLAYVAPHGPVDEFAVSAARVGDFAFDAREHLRSGRASDLAVTMIVAGMRTSLLPPADRRSPNADLNLQIATALVSCFAPGFFDAHGQLRSTWFERLCRVADESPADSDRIWHTARHAAHDVPRPVRWRW